MEDYTGRVERCVEVMPVSVSGCEGADLGDRPFLQPPRRQEATQVLADGIGGAEQVVLADTGHMFRSTHSKRYAGAVLAFLERAQLIDRGRLAS